MDSLRELEKNRPAPVKNEGTEDGQPSQNKLSYEARKEQSRLIKKIEKAITETEKQIASLEEEMATLEKQLSTPEGASDSNLYGMYADTKKALADAMDSWTEQTLELEELNT